MKIAIDCSQVVYGTGSSVYTKNLVKNLLNIDRQNQYLLFGGTLRRQSDLKDFYSSIEGASQKLIFPMAPTVADFVWNKMHRLSIEKLIGGVDLFHSSDWTQPPSKAYKVTTVHDLSPILFPKLAHPKIVEVHKRRLKWVKKEVDCVIAPSIATKIDLVTFGIAEERVKVIYEAPDSKMEISVKYKQKSVKRYFLGIGVSERKNTIRLIEAFQKFNVNNQYELLLVGNPVSGISITKNDSNIKFMGHITNHRLAELYTNAQGLLFPSLYEGFGLPILEAFAYGCPVLTSNRSSMAEIASNAAILVDPEGVESITRGMSRLLKEKDDLVEKGYIRLKDFNWEKTAKQTLKVYQGYKK